MLAIILGGYVGLTLVLAVWVSKRVRDADDFVVAGRRLGLPLTTATLLATWFGAGTMLTAADEVRAHGLRAAALEPIGAGVCLLLAGFFFARPLWRMKLLTLCDFYARRFGRRAEVLSAIVMVPGYFGWIAVQFVALAGMLGVLFGLDLEIGILLVAAVGTSYSLLGGMWAVAITDAAMLVVLLVGLVILAVSVLVDLGGFASLAARLPPEMLEPVPLGSSRELVGWLSVLMVSSLGNLPGQDLMQRVFSARSPSIARNACLLSGAAYLTFGAVPVLLGLAAYVLDPGGDTAIVASLAGAFLSPAMAAVFCLALVSAVLSTVESAILSPATVIAQNLLRHVLPGTDLLWLTRLGVAAVAAVSVAVALAGESAYSILEAAYEIGLVGLFVPLALGLARQPRSERPALAVMGFGFISWLVHLMAGWESFAGVIDLPPALPTIGIEIVLYIALDRAGNPERKAHSGAVR